MQRRSLLRMLPFALLVAGCASPGGNVLGARPPIERISLVRNLKEGVPATVQGRMVEKCPVAGCWFMLRDRSGTVRVDTKAAGFVVSDVPLNTEVTVSGTPSRAGELKLAARGMAY